MSSLLLVEIPQNSMVGQQRQQISELQFDKVTTTFTFLCWKIRFKNQVTTCSDFPSEAMLWITEVEMVDSLVKKSSRSIAAKNFPHFEILDGKFSSALNKIIQNSSSRRRSASRSRKPRKRTGFYEEDRSPAWSTTTFE